MPAIRTTDMGTEWLIRQLLHDLGEDPEHPGLEDTPARVVRMWKELLSTSYNTFHTPTQKEEQDTRLKRLFDAKFADPCDEMIVVKGIEFTSCCAHHMLPFFGHVHVGYLPNGEILGLSKFARVVDHFARKLQVQENFTSEVADALMESLGAKGVGVIAEGSHLCMKIRGVKKQDAVMVTSALRGCFKEGLPRQEFFSLVRR
jgi:GTP cyclohydrolase I